MSAPCMSNTTLTQSSFAAANHTSHHFEDGAERRAVDVLTVCKVSSESLVGTPNHQVSLYAIGLAGVEPKDVEHCKGQIVSPRTIRIRLRLRGTSQKKTEM